MTKINWIVAEDKKPISYEKMLRNNGKPKLLTSDGEKVWADIVYYDRPEEGLVGFYENYGSFVRKADYVTHWIYQKNIPLPNPAEKLETL